MSRHNQTQHASTLSFHRLQQINMQRKRGSFLGGNDWKFMRCRREWIWIFCEQVISSVSLSTFGIRWDVDDWGALETLLLLSAHFHRLSRYCGAWNNRSCVFQSLRNEWWICHHRDRDCVCIDCWCGCADSPAHAIFYLVLAGLLAEKEDFGCSNSARTKGRGIHTCS